MERKYIKSTVFKSHLVQWALPIVLALLLFYVPQNNPLVEKWYSNFLYKYSSKVLRICTGWLTFSIGDILYVLAGLYLVVIFLKNIFFVIKNGITLYLIGKKLTWIVQAILWLYIVFMLLWGLNYSRQGLAVQLQLYDNTYTVNELQQFTCSLQERINAKRVALGDSNYKYPSDEKHIQLIIKAYKNIKQQYPFLTYTNASAKTSLLYQLVSSAGYSGYYNPFSGEAQINEDVPPFYKPFVIAHEIAHQIGYGSESEASFTGYLVCMHSKNALLEYSALYELFASANNELFMYDAAAAFLNIKDLHPLVKRDRKIYRQYLLGKQNNFEPIIKSVYDTYLKANNQQNGIESYNDVVNWVMAYEKKYGFSYKNK